MRRSARCSPKFFSLPAKVGRVDQTGLIRILPASSRPLVIKQIRGKKRRACRATENHARLWLSRRTTRTLTGRGQDICHTSNMRPLEQQQEPRGKPRRARKKARDAQEHREEGYGSKDGRRYVSHVLISTTNHVLAPVVKRQQEEDPDINAHAPSVKIKELRVTSSECNRKSNV